MKPARLIIAALILLGLGAAVWYSQKHPPQPKSDFKVEKIISAPEDQFRRIEIRRAGAETLALEKGREGAWQILQPRVYKADETSVRGIVSSLASLNAERVVEEKNTEWKTYGLEPEKIRVEMSLKDGKSMKLSLGDEAPASSAVYARLEGDARLFTVSSYVKSGLEKSVNDLRDKRLLPFDSEKISRVKLVAGGRELEFGKAGSDWQILKPQPLRADSYAVDDLVRSARNAVFESEATAGPGARPFASFEAVDAAAVHRLTVEKDKENTYYARTTAMPGVFKISSATAEGLHKKLEDFRNKKVFDFGWSDPQKIELSRGDVRLAFEKKGEKWYAGAKEAPAEKIQGLLDYLRNLSARSFPAGEVAALKKPAAEAKVTSDNGKRVERVFLAAGPDSRYYAARENEPSVYEIEESAWQDFQKLILTLK